MATLPRIGDLLVEAGAITHLQLSEALSAQRERGGRLGTNLVELGFIDERKLAAVLARQLNLPSATGSQLDRVDAATIRMLPAKTAERLRAIPVREDKGKLWVAMADPTDPRVIEQLEKVLGKPVRPMVAPELLLTQALEKHYQIKGKQRGAQVRPRGPSGLRIERVKGDLGPITPLGSPLPPLPRTPKPPSRTDAPVYHSQINPPTGEVEKVAAYLDEKPKPPPAPRDKTRMSMREVAAQMAGAASDELVLDAALLYVAQDVQRLVALVLRGGRLTGVRGIGVNADRVRLVTLSLDESPLVSTVLATGESWLGRLFADELGGALVTVLGAARDSLGIVLPVRIGKRAAGAIVGVNASIESMSNKPDFDRLATKLDQALHINHLRRLLLEA